MTTTRLHRILWMGCTTEVEVVLAGALTLRAAWMLWPGWSTIPLETQGYLIPAGLPEWSYGLLLLSAAASQFLTARRGSASARAVVASGIAVLQTSVLTGYWQSGYFYRGVVPFIVAISCCEWWLAWRSWTTYLTQPRSGGA